MTVREFLAEQTRLADAATPGPWEFHQDDGSSLDISEVCVPRPDGDMPLSIASLLEDHDGSFIAASRTSVPRMVRALEAVLREVEAYEKQPDELEPAGAFAQSIRLAITDALDGYDSDEAAISDLGTVFGNAQRNVTLPRAARQEAGA